MFNTNPAVTGNKMLGGLKGPNLNTDNKSPVKPTCTYKALSSVLKASALLPIISAAMDVCCFRPASTYTLYGNTGVSAEGVNNIPYPFAQNVGNNSMFTNISHMGAVMRDSLTEEKAAKIESLVQELYDTLIP